MKLCLTSDIFSDTTHAAERFFSSRFLPRNKNSGRYRKQLHAYCTRRCIIAAARELALLIFILLFSTMPLITTPCPLPILEGRESGKKGWARFHRPCTLRRWPLPCNFILINPPLLSLFPSRSSTIFDILEPATIRTVVSKGREFLGDFPSCASFRCIRWILRFNRFSICAFVRYILS